MAMFDELKEDWKNQNAALSPTVNDILGSINKERNGIRRKFIIGIVLLALTMGFIGVVWMTFSFEYLTTKLALLTLVLTILAAVFYLIHLTQHLPKGIDVTKPSQLFVDDWLNYKKKSTRFSIGFMNVYLLLITIGMAFYLYEVTAGSTIFRAIAYGSTGVWILYFNFFMRPKQTKKTEATIQKMIDDFDKIKDQF